MRVFDYEPRVEISAASGVLRVTIEPRPSAFLMVLEAAGILLFSGFTVRQWSNLPSLWRALLIWGRLVLWLRGSLSYRDQKKYYLILRNSPVARIHLGGSAQENIPSRNVVSGSGRLNLGAITQVSKVKWAGERFTFVTTSLKIKPTKSWLPFNAICRK